MNAGAASTGGTGAGIAAVLAAMAAFTVGDSLMKLASQTLPLGQMVALRGVMATTFMLALAWHFNALPAWKTLLSPIVALRSIGEIGASLFFFSALMRMPIANATAVLQFVPLALTAASALFLSERVGWRRWLATSVGLAGVLIIIRPGADATAVGSTFAALSVLSITLRDIATRRISPQTPTLLIATVTAASVMTAGFALSPFEVWHWPVRHEWVLLAAAAVMVMIGNYLVIFALRSAEISVLAPFRYSAVVFAIVAGYLIWSELPDAVTLTGIGVVTAAGLYTYYRERVLGIHAPAVRRR